VRAVGRKLGLFGGTPCLSSQEGNGIVRKDSPFQGHNTVLDYGMENRTFENWDKTSLFIPHCILFYCFLDI
jgi:hypothetical protein